MKSKTWFLLSLALFLAAALFWRHGEQRQDKTAQVAGALAHSTPAVTPHTLRLMSPQAQTVIAPVAPKSKVSALVSKDPRHPYRLSNTPKKMGQLVRSDSGILLQNALIDTRSKLPLEIPDAYKAKGDPGSYIVQSMGSVNDQFRAQLKAANATIISYIPNNAYLVRMDAAGAQQMLNQPGVLSVVTYQPYYKLDPLLLASAVGGEPLPNNGTLRVTVFPGEKASAAQSLLALGSIVVGQDRSPFGPQIVVKADALTLPAIAQMKSVQMVESYSTPVRMNDLTRPRLGVATNTLAATPNYLGLSGTNVFVLINDDGFVDLAHPDLTNRVNVITNGVASILDDVGHATHLGGIIGSTGANGPNGANVQGSVAGASYRGIAPNVNLISMDFNQFAKLGSQTLGIAQMLEMGALTNLIYFGGTNLALGGTNRTLISNNSWGEYNPNAYDSLAAIFDGAARDAAPEYPTAQPVLYVVAAGNIGGGGDDGFDGTPDTIASPASAKNVITVGAIENLRNITNEVVQVVDCVFFTNAIWFTETDSSNEVASFSSRGNVGIGFEGDFGRFKPDVVAPGTFIASTRSTSTNWARLYKPYWVNTTSSLFTAFTTNGFFGTNTFVTIPTNSTDSYPSFLVPDNETQMVVTLIDVGGGTGASTLQIYTNTSPNPSSSPANFAGIGSFTNGPLGAACPGTDFYVDIVNTNTFAISYRFDAANSYMITTNKGDQFIVTSNLDNTLGQYYLFEDGTSMAAASVSGMLALMQEYLESLGINASPALMKALLINGARRVNPQYDTMPQNLINYEGWGLPNISNSLPAIIQTLGAAGQSQWPVQMFDQSTNTALATGQSYTYNVSLNPLAVPYPLRITLDYTDPPGNPGASFKLVNDLDLIVTNLDTKEVYFGNHFAANSDFTDVNLIATNNPPTVVDPSSTNDFVNNVENVYLPPNAGTNFSVTVSARKVNVNALMNQTNGVMQDYALVISSGNAGNIGGAMTISAPVFNMDTNPVVNYVTTSTNSANTKSTSLLKYQDVGANFSMLTDTNGTNLQWVFYVITNTTTFTNAQFVTFSPANLSVARNTLLGNSVNAALGPDSGGIALGRNAEADIDLYVSRSSVWANFMDLTNLDATLIDAIVHNTTGDQLVSTNRGGTEVVTFKNAQPNEVFCIGVKAEDQQAAQFTFLAQFMLNPNVDTNSTTLQLHLLGDIPDGTPDQPGALEDFAFVTQIDIDSVMKNLGQPGQPFTVGSIIVSNTMTHELYGDLVGILSRFGTETQSVVLNDHDTFINGQFGGTTTVVYDDSPTNATLNSIPVDGPGTLLDFVGSDPVGIWNLTMVDNAESFTGRVDDLVVIISPQSIQNLNNSSSTVQNTNLIAGGVSFYAIDVPADAVELDINAFITSGTGPLQLYLRRDDGTQPRFPSSTRYDYAATIVSPGGSLVASVSSIPPLTAGRYLLAVQNLDASNPVSFDLGYAFVLNPAYNLSKQYRDQGVPVDILDQTFTNSLADRINVNAPGRTVVSARVGFRIQHDRASDMEVRLKGPDGTTVLLVENRGRLSTNGYGMGTNTYELAMPYFSEDLNRQPEYLVGSVVTHSNQLVKFSTAAALMDFISPADIVTNFFVTSDIYSRNGEITSAFLNHGTNFIAGTTPYSNNRGFAAAIDFPVQTNSLPDWSFNWPDPVALATSDDKFYSVTSIDDGTGAEGIFYGGASKQQTLNTSPYYHAELSKFSLFGPFTSPVLSLWEINLPSSSSAVDATVGDSFVKGIVNNVEAGTDYIYATGYGVASAGASAGLNIMFITKVDPALGAIMLPDYDDSGVAAETRGNAIVALNGNIYVAGVSNTGPAQLSYLAQFDTSLNLITRTNGAAGEYRSITRYGNALYAVGVSGAAGSNVPLIEKWDLSTGTPVLTWSSTTLASWAGVVGQLNGVVGYGDRLYAVGTTDTAIPARALIIAVDQLTGDVIGSQTQYPAIAAQTATDDYGLNTAIVDGGDLYVSGYGLPPVPTGSTPLHQMMTLRCRIQNDFLAEETLNTLIGAQANGDWQLLITDNIGGNQGTNTVVSPSKLLGWDLRLQLSTQVPTTYSLAADTVTTAQVSSNQWTYFVVNAPFTSTACWIDFSNGAPSDTMELWYDQYFLPTASIFDTQLKSVGPTTLVLGSSGSPDLSSPGGATVGFANYNPGEQFYLGVRNFPASTSTNNFTITVHFDSTFTTFMVNNAAIAGSLSGSSVANVYQFSVKSGVPLAKFKVLSTTGNLNVQLRRGAVPTKTAYDYSTSVSANGTGEISLTPGGAVPDISGTWFARVTTSDASPVNYTALERPYTPPTVGSISATTAEDSPLNLTLPATDAENDPLTFTIITPPAHGVLSGTGANVAYTPNANYNGSDSFTFKANDGTFDSAVGSVLLSVTAVNDPPVVTAPVTASVNEDTPLSITGISVSDVDAGSAAITVSLKVSHGLFKFGSLNNLFVLDGINGSTTNLTVEGSISDLNAALGTLVYLGSTNFNGSESLVITANDLGNTGAGGPQTATKTVAITVVPVDDAPVATPQSVTTAEDTPVNITLAGTDVENDALTFAIVTGPTHGTLTGTGKNLTYTPSTNYNGADSFTFKANDGQLDSGPATVSITITAVNDPPVLSVPASATTDENTRLNISSASVSDVDAGSGLLQLSLRTTNGVFTVTTGTGLTIISGSNGSTTNLTLSGNLTALNNALAGLSYMPKTNYFGSDLITLIVNDQGNTGSGGSKTATNTVAVTVNHVNQPPLAGSQSVTVAENSSLPITLLATDPDNDLLTYIIVSGPSNGGLSGSGKTRTYTPNANYNGSDSFTFKVNDGSLDSQVATVTITVTAVNNPPVLTVPGAQSVNEDTLLSLSSISVADVDAGTGKLLISLTVTNGTLTLGTTSGLTFQSGTNGVTTNLTVEGTLNNLNNALATLSYFGKTNYNGADLLTVVANDEGNTGAGGAKTDTKTVAITVNAVNDPPVLTVPGPITLNQETTQSISGISVADVDAGGSPMQISLQVTNGVLKLGSVSNIAIRAGVNGATTNLTIESSMTSLNAALATLSYQPNTGFYGVDRLTVGANDMGNTGSGPVGTDSKSVALTINHVNHAPVANAQTVTTPELTAVGIALTATDADNDSLTYIVVAGPGHGSLTGSGASRTYTPAQFFRGQDSFTFKANDGQADSAVVTVTINVTAFNYAPTLATINDKTVDELTLLTFTASGSDPNGDTLTYSLGTGAPTGASINASSGVFTWTPTESQGPGTYNITVKVSDGTLSDSKSFQVTVNEVNTKPVLATIGNKDVDEGYLLTFTAQATDSDLPANTLTFDLVSAPTGATINPQTGVFSWTPDDQSPKSNTITVRVTDNGVPPLSDSKSFTVTVHNLTTNTFTLTSGMPITNSTTRTGNVLTEFYKLTVTNAAPKLLFELYNLSGDGDLLVRKGAFPTAGTFDFISANTGTNSEQVVVQTNNTLTDLTGDWYVAVLNRETNSLSYTVGGSVPVIVGEGALLVSTEGIKFDAPPAFSATNTTPQISWSTVVGEKYQVEVSTDLVHWTVLTNIVVTGPDTTFTDTTPYTDTALRFYRIQQVPQ